MKKFLGITVYLLGASILYSQVDLSLFSTSVGMIRNLQPDHLVNDYSLIYEIELGGRLLDSQTSWHIFTNYSDDHVNKIKPVQDLCVFYSYKSIGLGANVSYTITDSTKEWFPFKINLLGGLSMSFVKGVNIIHNEYFTSNELAEVHDTILSLELGFTTNYTLYKEIVSFVEYKQLFMLDKSSTPYKNFRNSLKLGVQLSF